MFRATSMTHVRQASEEAHDRLRHQGLQDGVMEIVYAASGGDDPRGGSPRYVSSTRESSTILRFKQP